MAWADQLAGPYTPLDHLWCDSLRMAVAPEIDTATLSWRFGRGKKEQDRGVNPIDYPPLDLNGRFVRVFFNINEDSAPFYWYGLVESDSSDIKGSTPESSGVQSFTAYGLLRLLERQTVIGSVVEPANAGADPLKIGRGLTFNSDEGGSIQERGNRSLAKSSGSYLFSNIRRRQSVWTAWQAVEYLLTHFVPRDSAGNEFTTWRLNGVEANLSWYQISVRTDRRNVKEIIDDLVDRRRGLGYWVSYNEPQNRIDLNVFTALDAPLTLPSGTVLPANPQQKSLDFTTAYDIERAILRDTESSRYDQVVALGAFKTTTGTFRFGDPSLSASVDYEIIPDWTDVEEADYLTGSSASDNEGGWKANAVYRSSDDLEHVYSRFVIDPGWNQLLDFSGQPYYAFPPTQQNGSVFPRFNGNPGEIVWNRGLVIEPRLTLRDRYNYDGTTILNGGWAVGYTGKGEPEFLPPIFFATTGGGTWQQLDKLSAGGPFESEERHYSVGSRVLSSGPSMELKVRGKPQHFIASTDFFSQAVGPFDEQHDPTIHGGIDWTDIRATLTVRHDQRLSANWVIQVPAPGIPFRVLYISAPEMRRDYVVPGTVVQVKNGVLVQSLSGGFVRDDLNTLSDIARTAAEWYSRERKTLELTFKQIRNIVSLGWLITELPREYGPQVNTPITAIEFDFALNVPTTTLETGYVAFDFLN